MLLMFGANANETNQVCEDGEECQVSPLILTCMKGCLQIAKLLFENGADVNLAARTTTPLRAAIVHDSEAVWLLLDHGANANAVFNGWSSMSCLSLFIRKTDGMRHLLEAGADMTRPGPDGDTPLTAASARGHVEPVLELLKQNANVHFVNVRGETALLSVHQKGHTNIFFLLLRASPQVWLRLQRAVMLPHVSTQLLQLHLIHNDQVNTKAEQFS